MTVLVFANGEIAEVEWLRPYFADATAVIAADGGSAHVLAVGQRPDVVVGDLDSLAAETVTKLEVQGVLLVKHSAEKNETDLELALLYAAAHYAEREILVFGVLGGRLDQTLANILLLAHPALRHKQVRLVEKYQQAWLVYDYTDIKGQVGDTVSLIPLGGAVHIAHTTNLKWPLEDEILSFGPARGVSNVLTAAQATVTLHSGQLLCIHLQQEWQR